MGNKPAKQETEDVILLKIPPPLDRAYVKWLARDVARIHRFAPKGTLAVKPPDHYVEYMQLNGWLDVLLENKLVQALRQTQGKLGFLEKNHLTIIRGNISEEYMIPETCDSDNLKGKFDGTVITITMPKKPISTSATPKEPKPAQEEAAKQVTPPTSTSGVEPETTIKKGDEKGSLKKNPDQKWRARKNLIRKKMKHQPHQKQLENLKSLKRIKKKFPKKVSKEIPQEGIKEDQKHRDEMERKDSSSPGKAEGESRMSQKDHQERSPRKRKLDDDEKHEENKRAEKKRTQEENKTSEEGKAPQKVQTLAREASKEKGSSGLKTPEKKEKQTDVKTGKVNHRNYGRKESGLSIGNGIKDIANSASQAVTRVADRFSEEDKQKLLYAGAAILMVAVGIYASFKVRSTVRP